MQVMEDNYNYKLKAEKYKRKYLELKQKYFYEQDGGWLENFTTFDAFQKKISAEKLYSKTQDRFKLPIKIMLHNDGYNINYNNLEWLVFDKLYTKLFRGTTGYKYKPYTDEEIKNMDNYNINIQHSDNRIKTNMYLYDQLQLNTFGKSDFDIANDTKQSIEKQEQSKIKLNSIRTNKIEYINTIDDTYKITKGDETEYEKIYNKDNSLNEKFNLDENFNIFKKYLTGLYNKLIPKYENEYENPLIKAIRDYNKIIHSNFIRDYNKDENKIHTSYSNKIKVLGIIPENKYYPSKSVFIFETYDSILNPKIQNAIKILFNNNKYKGNKMITVFNRDLVDPSLINDENRYSDSTSSGKILQSQNVIIQAIEQTIKDNPKPPPESEYLNKLVKAYEQYKLNKANRTKLIKAYESYEADRIEKVEKVGKS